jgi:hypothetical protein
MMPPSIEVIKVGAVDGPINANVSPEVRDVQELANL